MRCLHISVGPSKTAHCFMWESLSDFLPVADVKNLYEKVTAPPIPSVPKTPAPKRTQADIEREKRERAQELDDRKALRHREIPPYFESELGRAFLISNTSGKSH